jgi:predicted metal-dependent hydrolase
MKEKLDVGGLTFEVRRSARRKTLGVTVDRAGELIIHAPEGTENTELLRWTRSKLLWVHRKLAIKEELAAQVREPEYVTGESFFFLGRSYRLQVVGEQAEALSFDGRAFSLRRDVRMRAPALFRSWYLDAGKKWISARVALLAPRIGVVAPRVEVRDLGFHWGSCGKNNVTYFNWKLLQLPVRLADYVLAHELAHLIEPHHGREFWAVLERSLPDWRQRQEDLRRKAAQIYWCSTDMGQ